MNGGDADERPVWRVGRIASVVTLAWVVTWATAIAVLGSDRRAFNTLVRLSGNVVVRVLLAMVVVASVLHLVEGAGRLLPNHDPERWRAAAWFAATAAGIPSAVVLLWPFVDGHT
jgi:hypothetical protein